MNGYLWKRYGTLFISMSTALVSVLIALVFSPQETMVRAHAAGFEDSKVDRKKLSEAGKLADQALNLSKAGNAAKAKEALSKALSKGAESRVAVTSGVYMPGVSPQEMAAFYCKAASVYLNLNELQNAVKLTDAALKMPWVGLPEQAYAKITTEFNNALHKPDKEKAKLLAACCLNLAEGSSKSGNDANTAWQNAIDTANRLNLELSPIVYSRYAASLESAKKYEEAALIYEKLLNEARKQNPEDKILESSRLQDLLRVLSKAKASKNQKSLLKEQIELSKKASADPKLPKKDQSFFKLRLPWAMGELANYYQCTGQSQNAEKLLKERLLPARENAQSYSSAISDLVDFYGRQKRSSEIEKLYMNELTIAESTKSAISDDGSICYLKEKLADFYADQNKAELGKKLYDELLPLAKKEQTYYKMHLSRYAKFLRKIGEADKAADVEKRLSSMH